MFIKLTCYHSPGQTLFLFSLFSTPGLGQPSSVHACMHTSTLYVTCCRTDLLMGHARCLWQHLNPGQTRLLTATAATAARAPKMQLYAPLIDIPATATHPPRPPIAAGSATGKVSRTTRMVYIPKEGHLNWLPACLPSNARTKTTFTGVEVGGMPAAHAQAALGLEQGSWGAAFHPIPPTGNKCNRVGKHLQPSRMSTEWVIQGVRGLWERATKKLAGFHPIPPSMYTMVLAARPTSALHSRICLSRSPTAR